jgi:hypothetical protein
VLDRLTDSCKLIRMLLGVSPYLLAMRLIVAFSWIGGRSATSSYDGLVLASGVYDVMCSPIYAEYQRQVPPGPVMHTSLIEWRIDRPLCARPQTHSGADRRGAQADVRQA